MTQSHTQTSHAQTSHAQTSYAQTSYTQTSHEDQTCTQQAGNIPRLALVNDFTGFGRCSTVVSLPIISLLQVQVCPIPTAILSNHLGFSTCYFHDYTRHMPGYFHGWEELGLRFDGLYTGFLGNAGQIDLLCRRLDTPMFQNALFILDPVMGDHGHPYSSITREHCRRMKELVGRAHILTPNITEACILTDTPYKEDWSEAELSRLCRLLSLRGQKIVITGLRASNLFLNYIWDGSCGSVCSSEATGASRPGTGDVFSSVIAAHAMRGTDFTHSVRLAADFVALCIKATEAAGIPPLEGVLFEKNLPSLL